MMTEIYVESDVLELIVDIELLICELEKIYDTNFKLDYKHAPDTLAAPVPDILSAPDKLTGRWEVVFCETDTVFAYADTLDSLKEILGMYIESETKFVPQ